MIKHLTPLLDGIELYACPLEGIGRAAERAAVEKLGCEILHSTISHRQDGSPFAENYPDLPISVSHGASTALLAVGRIGMDRIGVDIESNGRNAQLERVRRRFVATADDSGRLSLLHLWTAKEAAYKAAGRPGLNLTDITIRSDGLVMACHTPMQVAWAYCNNGSAIIALATLVNY